MPASPAVLAALFSSGLAVGYGAAVLSSRSTPPPLSGPSSQAGAYIPAPASATPPKVVRDEKSSTLISAGQPAPITRGPVVNEGRYPASGGVAVEVFKYGFPGPTPDILRRTAYVSAYDRRMRHPSWTAEHITPTSLSRPPNPSSSTPSPLGSAVIPGEGIGNGKGKGDRSKSVFMEDLEVDGKFRALLKDYAGSGYDRGHMVPAADAKISQQAMDETFLLTNIAPQVGDGFNRHYWAYLEDFVRRLVRPRDEGMKGTGGFEDVYCFTVPLYLPSQSPDGKWRVSYEVIGNPPSISVPTHFAKVILASRPSTSSFTSNLPVVGGAVAGKDVALGAFVLPNAVIPDGVPLTTFSVPVESVERAAGLTLFSPAIKSQAKELCRETRCELIVRRFDDARKGGAGGGGGRGGRRESVGGR